VVTIYNFEMTKEVFFWLVIKMIYDDVVWWHITIIKPHEEIFVFIRGYSRYFLVLFCAVIYKAVLKIVFVQDVI